MSGLTFWGSGLVLGVSGLVFWVSELILWVSGRADGRAGGRANGCLLLFIAVGLFLMKTQIVFSRGGTPERDISSLCAMG